MNVFLVSPYHSGSHEAWANGYAAASSHHVELITMSGRFWKWRMHGGPVTLAAETQRRIEAGLTPDVILATDMVDVATYLGLLRGVVDVPVAVYFHENQFSYPVSPRSNDDLTFGAMNWKSMLAADQIFFNSQFHLDEVFEMLPGFLKNFPDYRHAGLIDAVRPRAQVLPVGVDLARFPAPNRTDPPLILWAQRWEHDKNPAEMTAAVDALIDSGAEFRIALAGENFRNEPEEFTVLAIDGGIASSSSAGLIRPRTTDWSQMPTSSFQPPFTSSSEYRSSRPSRRVRGRSCPTGSRTPSCSIQHIRPTTSMTTSTSS